MRPIAGSFLPFIAPTSSAQRRIAALGKRERRGSSGLASSTMREPRCHSLSTIRSGADGARLDVAARGLHDFARLRRRMTSIATTSG